MQSQQNASQGQQPGQSDNAAQRLYAGMRPIRRPGLQQPERRAGQDEIDGGQRIYRDQPG